MIGCCYKFVQTEKTGMSKALEAILAQVTSYHFITSLRSFNRLMVALGLFRATCVTSPHNALQLGVGLPLTLSQGLLPSSF